MLTPSPPVDQRSRHAAVFADLCSLRAEKDVWNDRMVFGTQFHTRQAHKLFHLRTVMTCADLVAGVIPKLWAARDPQQLYWTPVSARFLWCASVLWWATFMPVQPGHKFSWFFESFSLSSKIYCRMCDYVSRTYSNHFFLGQGSGKKVRKENFEAYHRTWWPLCYFNGMMRIIASRTAFFRKDKG